MIDTDQKLHWVFRKIKSPRSGIRPLPLVSKMFLHSDKYFLYKPNILSTERYSGRGGWELSTRSTLDCSQKKNAKKESKLLYLVSESFHVMAGL